MRFDSGGMGDASGPLLNFEQIDADIAAAVDFLPGSRDCGGGACGVCAMRPPPPVLCLA